MKIYEGVRGKVHTIVTVTDNGGDRRPLPLRLDLHNHSPSGFSWGYGGSGPSQLALAILADHFGNSREGRQKALEWYQPFKWKTTAQFTADFWCLTAREIDDILAVLEAEARGKI